MDINIYKDMNNYEEINFWFKVRRKIIENTIKKTFHNNLKDLEVLEIGSGSGGNLRYFSQKFKSIEGIEYSEEAIRYSKLKNPTAIISHGYLPNNLNTSKKYDLILLCDVLEHVEEDYQSLIEIKKLLKDNGKLLITVPAFMWLWSSNDDENHHKRRYTKLALNSLLIKAGYKNHYSSYFNFFLLPMILGFRMINNLFNKKKSTNQTDIRISNIFNKLLYWIFNLEVPLLKFIKFPFGVSIINVSTKD